jgi:hypothetical protein
LNIYCSVVIIFFCILLPGIYLRRKISLASEKELNVNVGRNLQNILVDHWERNNDEDGGRKETENGV